MANGVIKTEWIDGSTGYCKMSDGTLIQWGYKEGAISNNRTWGQMYLADLQPVTFPISFYSKPQIFLTASTASSFFPVTVITNATGITTVQAGRATAFNSELYFGYDWLAIGRWKA